MKGVTLVGCCLELSYSAGQPTMRLKTRENPFQKLVFGVKNNRFIQGYSIHQFMAGLESRLFHTHNTVIFSSRHFATAFFFFFFIFFRKYLQWFQNRQF